MLENNLGKDLRAKRKKKGLSQGQLSQLLKISTDMVSKIELGTREPKGLVMDKVVEFISGGTKADGDGGNVVINGDGHVDFHQNRNEALSTDIQLVVDKMRDMTERERIMVITYCVDIREGKN
jgi:transcriptional regulator with XRE-family HTH domain